MQETLEDIDKDGDGHVGIDPLVLIPTKLNWFLQVNIDEYIGDMYRDEGGEDGEHGIFLFISLCFFFHDHILQYHFQNLTGSLVNESSSPSSGTPMGMV